MTVTVMTAFQLFQVN